MSKTLVGYETIILIPAVEKDGIPWMASPTGLVDFSAPTADLLNTYISISTPSATNASQGGNISCAVLDDLDLGLTDSDTDDAKTVCSKGNTAALTFYNFNSKLNARRDADPSANSLANLFHQLTRAADVPYFIGHRVRGQFDSNAVAEVGQEWDFYFVYTDVQVPGFGDNENQQDQSAFVPKNIVNVRYKLAA